MNFMGFQYNFLNSRKPLKMKLFTLSYIGLFLFFSQSALSAEIIVDFKKIDLEEASLSGKKILVSFTAEWCLPCKLIDESLFQDEEIASLINEHFIPIKADIDSPLGNHWNDLYNANYLPTIVFANKSGNELERLKGIPKREGFLKLLKSMIKPKVQLAKQSQTHQQNASFASIKTTAEVEKVEEMVVSDYAIQFGAFGSKLNADRLISTLMDHGNNNLSILEEHTSNGKLLYKVLQTGFYSETEAISSLKTNNKKGFPGYIRKVK